MRVATSFVLQWPETLIRIELQFGLECPLWPEAVMAHGGFAEPPSRKP